jgi:toxin ParE1/3/4
MASEYALRKSAEADIDEILDYIAADNPQAAPELYSELLRLFDRLARFPESGRRRKELLSGLRSVPFGNYVVFFEGSNPIEINRVLHGARDINDSHFEE